MRNAILISATIILVSLANFAQAGSDVRSPDYWRESPNRWRSDQWRQSPVNNRNAPYRWNKEKWQQGPDNWRNKAYRKENENYRNSSQSWRKKAYKWNKEKWSNDPNNWRNKAYRFDKKQWQQSPLNWQNSPYRWDSGARRGAGDIDIQIGDGGTDSDKEKRAPQTGEDKARQSEEFTTPSEELQPKGPRVVEVEKGARGANGKYSSRVLPVINIHGDTRSAAKVGGKTAIGTIAKPRHLNGFAVYGLKP